MTLVTPFVCTAALTRQVSEGSLLAAARTVYGDEHVAGVVLNRPYDAGFVGRHTNQLSTLLNAHLEAASDE